MKRNFSTLPLALLLAGAGPVLHAAPIPNDRVVLYDMKEDPTVASFVGTDDLKGFYTLELDEAGGQAAILYRKDGEVFRSPASLKIKGDQIILKNKKNRKTLLRGQHTFASGRTEEIVYAPECPPEKGGWRFGPSFGRHLVRLKDDVGRRVVAVQTNLEYGTLIVRCADADAACGPPGCPEWAGTAVGAKPAAAPTPKTPVAVKLSTALIDATMRADEILATFQRDINAALPATLPGLTALSTGYHTMNLPYPAKANPTFDEQNKAIGVIYKTYLSTSSPEPLRVEVAPLLPDYQAASLTKCGSAWETSPMKTVSVERGYPTLFIETPATGNTPAASAIVVCGQSISVLMQTNAALTKDTLTLILSSFPIWQMESLVGGR